MERKNFKWDAGVSLFLHLTKIHIYLAQRIQPQGLPPPISILSEVAPLSSWELLPVLQYRFFVFPQAFIVFKPAMVRFGFQFTVHYLCSHLFCCVPGSLHLGNAWVNVGTQEAFISRTSNECRLLTNGSSKKICLQAHGPLWIKWLFFPVHLTGLRRGTSGCVCKDVVREDELKRTTLNKGSAVLWAGVPVRMKRREWAEHSTHFSFPDLPRHPAIIAAIP